MPLERDSEGDSAKRTSQLDETLAISSELGMQPLMERVLAWREILSGVSRHGRSSQREL